MASVNDVIRDHVIGHQVDLTHYANGVVERMIAILNRTDKDLFAQLTSALEQMDAASFTADRLEELLTSVRVLNRQAYLKIERELTTELRAFADVEAQFQYELFTEPMPPRVLANVTVATVSAEQVYAAALARPFQGRLLREWASGIEADRMVRIRDAIRTGYLENQSIGEMVKRIRGTRANNYADGLLEIDRRHAEAVVRTAVSHTAGFTRDRFQEANADLIKAVQWLSTLDNRTTPICIIRDRKEYTNDSEHRPIGHKIPWLGGPGAAHWNCRSTSTVVLKSWREIGLNIDDFPESTRASMDGQVAAETTYPQWLERQNAGRQDGVLGPTRGALLRSGGLKVEQFFNDKGRFLTLEQLRERSPGAFRRAGV
ncbi:MAG: hypothetical protein IPJ61_18590 [Tessaracoccus sp.]|uniref:hypothetical protein n=1 Tax=Tessaracoccus sp. TaxID=1971211 RepID=UPI001ED5EFAA|nr:hypothetical protein [Tessaracoccus sp.]MBK7822994.1 hypothetical protein [Tessaracoccus sp.]